LHGGVAGGIGGFRGFALQTAERQELLQGSIVGSFGGSGVALQG
jgi:hypothetical protein